jgi:hypothetical protein
VVPPPPLRSGQQVANGQPHRPGRRRHRRVRVAPLVALLALGGFAVWGARQEGGVSGVFERFGDWIEGRVDDVTGSSDIAAAVDYLNEQYRVSGTYPRLSAEDMRAVDEVELTGLELVRCTPNHMVVTGFTARGTVSYLIVAGDDWGKVQGRQACPTNLLEPAPWTVPPPPDAEG